MKKTFSSKKSAFSLIELSIVLIIIGLLIAGVTGGASLIKNSELRAVMGEARGYAVAVNAFYTQFNALPGDYGTAIGNAVAGDNDTTIEYFAAATTAPTGSAAIIAASESANAWVALRTIGAIDGISSAAPVAATTAPVFGATLAATAPASKIRSAGWAFDYRVLSEFNGAAANQNVVVLTGAIGTGVNGVTGAAVSLVQGANLASGALTPTDALSVDVKIDDGVPNAGKIRGLNPGVAAAPAAAAAAAPLTCYTQSATAGTSSAPVAGVYVTAQTTKNCALTYQIDVNS